jgi:FkbM family methyltransferase
MTPRAQELLDEARRVARETLAGLQQRAGAVDGDDDGDDAQLAARIVARARQLARTDPGLMAWLAGRVIAVPAHGRLLMVDLGDWTSWLIIDQHGWETGLTDLCLRAIKPGDLVLDVGAHTGGHTVAFATRAERVVAFEPVPANVELLRLTLAVNELEANVSVEPLALGDRTGRASLHAYAPSGAAARFPGASGMLHSLVAAGDYAGRGIEVALTTLDDWSAANGVSSVGFIKIDVEGAELMILRGGRALLGRSPRVKLVVEVHPAELRAAGARVGDVLDLLRAEGFGLYQALAGRGGLELHTLEGHDLLGHHVMARR